MAAPPSPTGRKLLWFLALWLAGLGILGTVAFILRSILKLAGG